jgi:hypothetical protein
MSGRSGADVSISIEVTSAKTISTIKPLDGPPLIREGELCAEALFEHRKTLGDDLESLKGTLTNQLDQDDWDRIDRAFAILRKRSNLLFHQLFGREQPLEVHTALAKALAFARAAGRLAFVEVVAQSLDTVPLEFLRVRQQPAPTRIKDPATLAAAAGEFLGFSAIVKRSRLDNPAFQEQAPVLENRPKLPVKFFWDNSLGGAKSEKEFFEKYGALIDLEGPWPDGRWDGREAYRTVAEHLWNPQLKFGEGRRPIPDQIQHFACHYYVADSSEASFFRVGFDDSQGQASLGDIDSYLGDLAVDHPRAEGARLPLVFANACASSVIRPGGLLSLPELVLRNKNIGYVGTETRIPDEAAHKFSESFYEHLLRQERLGEAITRARLQLLNDHQNPLGILYTLYADPDICVAQQCDLNLNQGGSDDRK